MRFVIAYLIALTVLVTPVLAQTTETTQAAAAESTAGAWGGLLWIALMIVITVALLAVALVSLRPKTKD